MKVGIRTKLVIAFVAVIVGPVIITSLVFGMAVNHLNNDPEMVQFTTLNTNFQKVIQGVEDNFHRINDYEAFDKIVRPLLEEFNGKLRIVDDSGSILYASSSSWIPPSEKGKEDSEKSSGLGWNPDTGVLDISRYSYTVQMGEGDAVEANIIIDYDIDLLPSGIAQKIIRWFGGSFAFGLLSMIILIIFFSWLISRSILVPLNELNEATESIAQGDLDFSIQYRKKNELGRFCEAFDTMRVKLKESLEEQASSEEKRKTLIASISHDLRTPISSIKGYVEGLQDGIANTPEQFERYLRVIKDKTQTLDDLIEDLFQFSQIDLGKLHMDFEIMDSQVLLEDALEGIAMDLQQTHVELIIHRPLPSVWVEVDYKRMGQTLDNIIQNAVRYVDGDGLIEIESIVKGGEWIVSIGDNGIGIDPKDLSHIFEGFYRGEKSRSRNYGGTGLGLAICKYIIENHGGRIWAGSALGEGTIVYLALPIVYE